MGPRPPRGTSSSSPPRRSRWAWRTASGATACPGAMGSGPARLSVGPARARTCLGCSGPLPGRASGGGHERPQVMQGPRGPAAPRPAVPGPARRPGTRPSLLHQQIPALIAASCPGRSPGLLTLIQGSDGVPARDLRGPPPGASGSLGPAAPPLPRSRRRPAPPLACRMRTHFGTRRAVSSERGQQPRLGPRLLDAQRRGRVPLGAAPGAMSPGGPHSQRLPTSTPPTGPRCPLVAGQAPVGVARDFTSLWGQHLRALRVGELPWAPRCGRRGPSCHVRGWVQPRPPSLRWCFGARTAGKGAEAALRPCPVGQLEPLVLLSEPLRTAQCHHLGRGDLLTGTTPQAPALPHAQGAGD